MLLVKEQAQSSQRSSWRLSHLVLIAGFLLFVLPPMVEVARFNWSTEQGGHGPIVLATGLWLLNREFGKASHLVRPGNVLLGSVAMVVLVALYIVAGITGILELSTLR